MNMETTTKKIDWTRINNDVNGNPRFVCHFLTFKTSEDEALAEDYEKTVRPFKFSTSHLYDIVVNKVRKIGGKRFDNKQYGGGIVFSDLGRDKAELFLAKLSGK